MSFCNMKEITTAKEKIMAFADNDIIDNIISVTIWGLCMYSLIYYTISRYQVPKDIFFHIAGSCLILLAFWIRKIKLLSLPKCFFALAFAGSAMVYLYINRNSWGPEYAKMLCSTFFMYFLCGLFVIDSLENKVDFKNNLSKNWFLYVFLFATILLMAIGQKYASQVVAPIAVLYLTPISEKTWKKQILFLSEASYLVFVFLLVKSFIVAPHEQYLQRYVGIFFFPVAGGLLSFIAIFGCFYMYHYFMEKNSNKKMRILFAVGLLFPIAALFLFMDRAVILGTVTMVMGMFIFCSDKKKAMKRGLIIFSIVVLLFTALMISLSIFLSIDTHDLEEYVYNTSKYSPLKYIAYLLIDSTKAESYTGVFKIHSIWNALDRFSSARIGIWICGLKKVTLFGTTNMTVYLPNGENYEHVHNTYIEWLMRLGFIGGIPLNIWYFSYLVKAIKKKMTGGLALFPSFLIAIFNFTFFIVERELFCGLPLFMLLIFQYPLLRSFKEE